MDRQANHIHFYDKFVQVTNLEEDKNGKRQKKGREREKILKKKKKNSRTLGLVVLVVPLLVIQLQTASSTVVLNPLSISFPDLPAKSAVEVGSSGVCGALHVADPIDACSPLVNANGTHSAAIEFVLIERGKCSFDDKIRNAQASGFRAAIVFDDKPASKLVYSYPPPPCFKLTINPEGVKVHAVFVSEAAGLVLKSYARGDPGECCIYPLRVYKAWTVLAISLISLAIVLAFLIAAIAIPRHWLRNWYGRTRLYRRNVDAKVVEALPSFTFQSSFDLSQQKGVETCAICLEDYKDGEALRFLPCHHAFHSSCVDSWLTKWGTFCPICKLDLRTNASNSEVAGQRT